MRPVRADYSQLYYHPRGHITTHNRVADVFMYFDNHIIATSI